MIRKHKGINQKTGKLKPGYVYTGEKTKSGLSKIKKVQKGGVSNRKVSFDRNVRVEKIRSNDCPPSQRPKKKVNKGEKKCGSKKSKFITANGFHCCRKKKVEKKVGEYYDLYTADSKKKDSKLRFPEMLKPEMVDFKRKERRLRKKEFKTNPKIVSKWEVKQD